MASASINRTMALTPTPSSDLHLPLPPTSSFCNPTCFPLHLLKSAIQNLLLCHACRAARALSMASVLTFRSLRRRRRHSTAAKTSYNIRNIFFGSFRMHYNWCSSHVVPAPSAMESDVHRGWTPAEKSSSSSSSSSDEAIDFELWRYLELEEGGGDIDELAELFIAKCHEKFRLEKQESYRRRRGVLAQCSD